MLTALLMQAHWFYGRFLSVTIVIAKPMAIAMIIAAPVTAKYISVGGSVTSGYGDAVAAASPTAK